MLIGATRHTQQKTHAKNTRTLRHPKPLCFFSLSLPNLVRLGKEQRDQDADDAAERDERVKGGPPPKGLAQKAAQQGSEDWAHLFVC